MIYYQIFIELLLREGDLFKGKYARCSLPRGPCVQLLKLAWGLQL